MLEGSPFVGRDNGEKKKKETVAEGCANRTATAKWEKGFGGVPTITITKAVVILGNKQKYCTYHIQLRKTKEEEYWSRQ